ncbi:hypothetical protein V1477_006735 [Vespula maculifrons]|uniref:Uncharacterized protein n=1 Tax=Vespula maculifrons TaxID=7453 RepID=A0ABD2CGI7_VESMC
MVLAAKPPAKMASTCHKMEISNHRDERGRSQKRIDNEKNGTYEKAINRRDILRWDVKWVSVS